MASGGNDENAESSLMVDDMHISLVFVCCLARTLRRRTCESEFCTVLY